VVSFTPRPLYPQGNNSWYPLDRRLGGPQSRFGRGGEEKNFQRIKWTVTSFVSFLPKLVKGVLHYRKQQALLSRVVYGLLTKHLHRVKFPPFNMRDLAETLKNHVIREKLKEASSHAEKASHLSPLVVSLNPFREILSPLVT
jgi:hypothetical protein